MPKAIVITTFGSLGDLHPYLAIALGLAARGRRVKIATGEAYRAKVESEGIEFHPVRPNISPDDHEAIRLAMDARKGSEYVLRHMFFPHVRSSYEDLTEAVAGADLLVTHPITYAGPLVAEKTGEKQATAKKVVVKQGQNYNGQVEILTGLKKGDWVISTGFQDVNNGEVVAF